MVSSVFALPQSGLPLRILEIQPTSAGLEKVRELDRAQAPKPNACSKATLLLVIFKRSIIMVNATLKARSTSCGLGGSDRSTRNFISDFNLGRIMRSSRLPSTKSHLRHRVLALDAFFALSAPLVALLLRNPTLLERSDALRSFVIYTFVSFAFCLASFISFQTRELNATIFLASRKSRNWESGYGWCCRGCHFYVQRYASQ